MGFIVGTRCLLILKIRSRIEHSKVFVSDSFKKIRSVQNTTAEVLNVNVAPKPSFQKILGVKCQCCTYIHNSYPLYTEVLNVNVALKQFLLKKNKLSIIRQQSNRLVIVTTTQIQFSLKFNISALSHFDSKKIVKKFAMCTMIVYNIKLYIRQNKVNIPLYIFKINNNNNVFKMMAGSPHSLKASLSLISLGSDLILSYRYDSEFNSIPLQPRTL